MSKRKKLILASFLMSLGLGTIRFLGDDYRYYAIMGVSLLSLVFSGWSLREGLNQKTLVALILPVYLTFNVSWFWFLLPNNFYSSLPVVIGYGIFFYILLLTLNIYMVTIVKTIALFRTALSVGFILTLVTAFLMFDNIFSLKLPFYLSTPLVFIFVSPLVLLNLWSVNVLEGLNRKLFSTTFFISLIISELAVIIYFWPVKLTILSLFLTASIYVLVGLAQIQKQGRLFASTVREYLIISIFVLLGLFLTTSWR